MSNVFDVALRTIFNDPNMVVSVRYVLPDMSDYSDVTMLKQVVPVDLVLDQSAARMLATTFEVLVEDLTPQRGGKLIVDEEEWEIKSAVQKDESDRIWVLDVVRKP